MTAPTQTAMIRRLQERARVAMTTPRSGTSTSSTSEAPEPPASAGEAGPAGSTIADVLEWVGDDTERAQAAYDTEAGKDSPRTTLLAELEARGATP